MNLPSLLSRQACLKPFSRSAFLNTIHSNFRLNHAVPHRLLSSATAPNIRSYSPLALHPTSSSSILQFVSSRIRNATHRDLRTSRLVNVSGRARPPPSGRPQGSGQSSGQSFRNRFNTWPPNLIIYGILGLNGVVFSVWYLASTHYQANRDPSWLLFMRRNFTASYENLRSGRIWTLLTASFSHKDVGHILFNAFTFYFMAPVVLQMLGNSRFMALYLFGGLACSGVSIIFNTLVKGRSNYSSHGASGAIYSVISFLACAAPRMTFQLYGIIPIPAWLCVSGIFLWDGYKSLNDRSGGTDTAGHIGGLVAGALAFLALRFRIV